MKLMTYSQLEELEPGSYVNGAISGHVGRLEERKGKNGVFLTGEITIGTNHCEVTFFRDDVQDNTSILITGQGIKRDEYKGKMKLIVGDKATIKAGEQHDEPQPEQRSERKPTQPDRSAPPKTGGFKVMMNKIANTYIQSYISAEYIRNELKSHGNMMTEEHFQATVSSMFIQATRENLHLEAPTGPFDWSTVKVKQVREEEPEDDNVPY
jgi:hypothetical protein